MIKTSRQLKDKVRNMARGDSAKAQLLIRNYGMERFLERVSLSEHRDNFILKGGMLVSALVGLENRATMDIDTSIRNMPLDTIAAKAMVEEIIAVPVDDNIRFEINDFGTIMDFPQCVFRRNSNTAENRYIHGRRDYASRCQLPIQVDVRREVYHSLGV